MHRADEKPTRVRWLVFFLAAAASWLLYLHRYAWGVVKADVKAELGFSDTELGWLDSAFNAAYALLQVPAGLLGDVLGPAMVLPLLALGWSASLAATSAGAGFWTLCGARAIFGAFQAGAYPSLGKVTRSWFPASVRTTVQGVVATLGGRSGGACAALVVGTLLLGLLGLGWRGALVTMAVPGAAFALIFGLIFRDTPARHPWSNEAERRLVEAGAPAEPAGAPWMIDRRPRVLVGFAGLLLHLFTSAFADILYVYWLPLFFEEAKGLGKVQTGLFASLPLWAGGIGGVAGGTLNDVLARRFGRRAARCSVGLCGKLAAALLVVASIRVEGGVAAMAVLSAGRFFNDWSQPTAWGTITDIGGRAVGSVFGVVNTVGSLGAFAAGPILGAVKQHFGWSALLATIAGVELISGLAWLLIDPTRPIVKDAFPARGAPHPGGTEPSAPGG